MLFNKTNNEFLFSYFSYISQAELSFIANNYHLIHEKMVGTMLNNFVWTSKKHKFVQYMKFNDKNGTIKKFI